MTDAQEVTCRAAGKRTLWGLVALGAAGVGLAAVSAAHGSGLLAVAGLLLVLVSLCSLYVATSRVSADAYGVRSRTPLRRRNMPWSDIADLRVYVQYGRNEEIHRVSVLLRDGRTRRLPLALSGSSGNRAEFAARLDALRALHRRHGDPESDHTPVIAYGSAGRFPAVTWILCVLLLAGAALAAWFVPGQASEERAWRAAVPCTSATPATERSECLSTRHAVIERTKVSESQAGNWLYFADGRPLERLRVSHEGAVEFRPGDRVELTVWRHQVRKVAGAHHVWRDSFTGGGEVAVIAAVCALAAGYPGACLLLRRRGRRLPDDEVLPSALPFAAALVGTAVWLLPFCYHHPTDPFGTPGALAWAAGGTAATLWMITWAWRATRIRTPGDTPATGAGTSREAGDLFLTAHFLEHTDYNPHGFGTHIVIGEGPPAVTPHPGPGRFAARPIPVERLSVTGLRRARSGDGESVHRSWHIAEMDDAGEPVRLAAAPDDLTRILDALGCGRLPQNAGRGRP